MRAIALLVRRLATGPAAAQWKSVEPVTLKGAHGVIIIPENWNGGLFI